MSQATPAAALVVTDAKRSFGRVRALEKLSLSLHHGEWVALLGPNGAGKTTLMRAISGLVRLHAGEIVLIGTKVQGSSDSVARRVLGVVPQDIALFQSLSARENLNAFGRLHGLRDKNLRARTAWALEWTQLSERADDLVATFSGGMKRRLNIACGVLHEPRVVLLDEPTVGVDLQARQLIWAMLDDLRQQGVALLQSTHQLEEVQDTCDRVLIMDHGRIIASGTLPELMAAMRLSTQSFRLTLDRPPNGLMLNGDFEVNGTTIKGPLGEVAGELAELLARINASGLTVCELSVDGPRLTEIFTHFTGEGLRE